MEDSSSAPLLKVLFPLFAGLWKMEEQKKAVAVVVVGRAKNWLLKADYNWPFEVRRSFFGMRVLSFNTHEYSDPIYSFTRRSFVLLVPKRAHLYSFHAFQRDGRGKKVCCCLISSPSFLPINKFNFVLF